jgi:hypothetical protein
MGGMSMDGPDTSPGSSKSGKSVQVKVTLTSDEADALDNLVSDSFRSRPAALRQALATELFLTGLRAEGYAILAQSPDGDVHTIDFAS